MSKRVKCPVCKRADFELTDQYDPDITPHGAMLRSTLGYHIDWLTTKTTGVSEMTCPECMAQLAPSGKFTIIDVPDRKEFTGYPCDKCNRIYQNESSLIRHRKTHEENV